MCGHTIWLSSSAWMTNRTELGILKLESTRPENIIVILSWWLSGLGECDKSPKILCLSRLQHGIPMESRTQNNNNSKHSISHSNKVSRYLYTLIRVKKKTLDVMPLNILHRSSVIKSAWFWYCRNFMVSGGQCIYSSFGSNVAGRGSAVLFAATDSISLAVYYLFDCTETHTST